MRWIFLRGLVREQRHWGEFRPAFQKRFGLEEDQVIALDFPGIGTENQREFPLSMAALVEDLRARARIAAGEKVTIFSMSLGSMCALQWASMHPGEIAGLVVVNTSAANLSSVTDRASWFAWKSFGKIFASRNVFERERHVLELTSNLKTDRGDLVEFWASFAPPKRDFLRTASKQLWVASRFSAPASLSVPLLVLSSSADRLVSAKCSAVLARRYGVENHVHLKGGHDLILDDPEWIIQRTAEWAESLPRSP
jgi:pimeloyl-ACP methyl ester carboxylesterase